VAAAQGVSATTFQGFVDEVIRDGYDEVADNGTTKHYDIKFDPSARERVAGPAKPGKGDLEMARQFIAQPNDGLHTTLGKIAQVTGTTVNISGLEGDALVNAVALAVRDYRLAIARTATAGLMGGDAPAKKSKKNS
jgi:hypothetical protein